MLQLTSIKKHIMNKILAVLFLSLLFNFSTRSFGQETIIKGKLHNWITDTIYIVKLPFHSPYSYSVQHKTVDRDSSFVFNFMNEKKPFVFFLSPKKEFVDNQIKELLFDNLTENHYLGHCSKFYLNSTPTFLIEPGKTIQIDLKYNVITEQLTEEKANHLKKLGVNVAEDNTVQDYGEAKIKFIGEDKFQNEYYQKSFMLDDIIDKTLSAPSSENLDFAISKLKYVEQSLLNDLKINKDKLSSFFYEYIKSEIEFGTRKEFLKYLRFQKEGYLKEIIKNGEIPSKLFDIIAFNTYKVNEATLLSEEYNEYIENYVNLIMSINNGEFVKYHPFNVEKVSVLTEELPINSLYYYITNHLLIGEINKEGKMIAKKIIKIYPDGELNDKLIEKFKV
jgi:hypothetical protein